MNIRFSNFSLASKLNVVQGVIVLAVIFAATAWTAFHLRMQLEQKALLELKQTNALVVSMFEAYDHSLRNDIERVGRIFAGSFDKQLELVTSGDSPRLIQRGVAISENFDFIDVFSARSGAVATVLVRQGDDFLRTATSLKKEDGSRSSGVPLGPEHPARASLLAGIGYTGIANMFGKDYITNYTPVRDVLGKVVGGFFVGIEVTESLKALKKSVLAVKIGTTGYVYSFDAGRNKGTLTIHPTKEGTNLLAAKDSRGFEFIREMLDKKSGVVRYDWANPGESTAREKIVAFEHYPGWNWIIASGSYKDEFLENANDATRAIAELAFAIIIAALASGALVTRHWVSKPLERVMAEADRIASGDLTGNLQGQSNDEVGRLTQAIGKMAGYLKSTIAEIRTASATMLDQSLSLVSAAEQVSRSSRAQSDSATGMAASVEEMSVSIDQVAQHAIDAQRISAVSSDAADHGGEVISQAVGAMEEIAGSVREASAAIAKLGSQSKDISAVVQVIREIADQTNLLALNAAIEAARAGEHGRGFAVVADEVRKLAERTAKSTHSIAKMITGIQHGASAAVDRMEHGVAQVEKGCVLADQAGRSIGEIRASTKDVICAVGGISDAIGEQGLASQTIANGVEQVAQMAEGNHNAAMNTASAANALRAMATKLDQSLGRFRIV